MGASSLFTHVGHQGHEPSTLYSILDGALKGSTIATALSAKQLALVSAHLF